MGDESDSGGSEAVDSTPWALYQDRLEHARAAARARYREHLAAALARHDVADPATLADVALDALTVWRYVDSGAVCRCSCHPRLPDNDLHDYGFDCPCKHSTEYRRRALQAWRTDIETFWQSAKGQQIAAATHAADKEVGDWLATQHGVEMQRLCDFAPEHWSGSVDGHRFNFRERHREWDIEIEQHRGRQSLQDNGNTDHDRTAAHRAHELCEGETIACGTIADAGYGTTPVERAQFVVDTIRIYLIRKSCSHQLDTLASLEGLLGTPVPWCPWCGSRLHLQHRGSGAAFETDADEKL